MLLNHFLLQLLLALLIILFFFAFPTKVAPVASRWWLICFFHCPKSSYYSSECLDAITTPYPICFCHTSEDWVNIDFDSIPRCCETNLSECRCPVKDSKYFLNKSGNYCKGADICRNEGFPPANNIRVYFVQLQ